MATTRVYRDYESFRRRAARGNGISVGTLMENYNGDMERAIADNRGNDGCWECIACRDCTDCARCVECTGLNGLNGRTEETARRAG